MPLRVINVIADEVLSEPMGGDKWSLEASQRLALDIAERVDDQAINIRRVQEGDNLGRIAEGLSKRTIKLKEEGGKGWEIVQVIYVGNHPQAEEQKSQNPGRTLSEASLIYPGQYVALKNNRCVIVGQTAAQIRKALS